MHTMSTPTKSSLSPRATMRLRRWGARALAVTLTAAATLAMAPAVEAHPRPSTPANLTKMRQGPVELTAIGEDGRSLDAFAHEGRFFLAGHAGERYELQLRNRSGTRIEVVVSVDGRDVLTGEEADYTVHRGYVIPAWGTVTIAGFRRSFDEVAAFRFSSPGASYSAQLGTPQHVGVIGVAAFKERAVRRRPTPTIAAPTPERPRPSVKRKRASRGYNDLRDIDGRFELESSHGGSTAQSNDAPSSSPSYDHAPSPDMADGAAGYGRTDARARAHYGRGESVDRPSQLGTAWGESRRDRVRETRFRRRNSRRPDVLIRVDYDSEEGLYARGVIEPPRPHVHRPRPDPFPGRTFAGPPPGRW